MHSTLTTHIGSVQSQAGARLPWPRHPQLRAACPRAAGDSLHALVAGFPSSDPRHVAPDVGDATTAGEVPAAALLRSPARFRGSGLDAERAAVARELIVEAACLA